LTSNNTGEEREKYKLVTRKDRREGIPAAVK